MTRKIALLVIHGIGEQEPFETLDMFARPFIKNYTKLSNLPKAKIRKNHCLMKCDDWIDNYISIIPDDKDLEIDIHEYYWSYMTQRQIKASEIFKWITKVTKGAKSFYGKRDEENNPNNHLFKDDGEFKYLKYPVRMLSFGGWLTYLYPLISLPLQNIPLFEKFASLITNVTDWVIKPKFVDYFGDVAIYCNRDSKSQYYETHKKILDGAVKKVKSLLSKENDYSEIILAGHSLGSVVAYDLLGELNNQINVDKTMVKYSKKIKGLITFGSPLDKIAFFFDEHIKSRDQNYRYEIAAQLHGFRRKYVKQELLSNSIESYFDQVNWFNFWSETDIVSGHLDVYKDVKNINIDYSRAPGFKKNKLKYRFFPVSLAIESHEGYWDCGRMQQKIINEFILNPVTTPKETLKKSTEDLNATESIFKNSELLF